MVNLAIFPAFGVIDDHTLTKTLFLGESIPFFIIPQIGRFFPLDAIDLNLIYLAFGGINANLAYAFSALFAALLVLCLFFALNPVLKSSTFSLFLIVCLLLSPAFPSVFLRLFVPEKLEGVLFGAFLFAFIAFHRRASWGFFALAIASGSAALYFKEVAFIALGGFAFFHFIFNFKDSHAKSKLLDLALMASCALWVVVYFVVVVLQKTTKGSYGDTPYNPLLVFAKNLANYALNEPFLFIAFRAVLILRRISKIHPLLDSLLLAAALHNLAYLTLNIYDFHYPFPAMILALLPLGYYFRAHFGSVFVRAIFVLCVAIYATNGAFAFAYKFNHLKAVPNNFQNTLSFLDGYLKENPRTNIYLEGVNRASGVEIYASFGEYLAFLGHEDFDLQSDLDIDNSLLGREDSSSPYAVFKSNAKVPKKPGDLVIFTPYATYPLDAAHIDFSQLERLFESKWGLNLGAFGLKALLKSAAAKSAKEAILSTNLYQLPIHILVYRVR